MTGILESFVALLVIMDPIGNLSLFISMTKGIPTKEVKKNADKSILVASFLLFMFLFFGIEIFDFFNINLDSFQIAGGIILLIIGLMYVFGISFKFAKPHSMDLSVPIGTPLVTGPGAIMTTIILVKEQGIFATFIAASFALLATWLVLRHSSKLYKTLGEHWTNIISRVMGVILASIAIKFITNGILNIIKYY